MLRAWADALERKHAQEDAHAEELRHMQDRLQRLIEGAQVKDVTIARLTADVNLLTQQRDDTLLRERLQASELITMVESRNAAEVTIARLRRLMVHCDKCGADYAATGLEAGCSCELQATIARMTNSVLGFASPTPPKGKDAP